MYIYYDVCEMCTVVHFCKEHRVRLLTPQHFYSQWSSGGGLCLTQLVGGYILPSPQ